MTPPRRAPHPALAAWQALRESGAERGALVTLARADGGAARPLGMHLAMAPDGRAFGSVTIGGCADGRALLAAERVLRTGRDELITVPLGEEDALALGLGCAGDVDLLVEAVALERDAPTARAFDTVERALSDGRRAALVTALHGGGVPRVALSDRDTTVAEASEAVSDVALGLAREALALGATESVVREAAGGRWLVQPLAPQRTVLVVGATDVAAALCSMAAPLGWTTVLVDARDDVLGESRFAAATEREAAMPAERVAARLSSSPAAVVIVAHDYKVELPVLRVALRSAAPYVGMLGSRRRAEAVRQQLRDDGLGDAELARLRAPIGLPLGAQGPAEIAVSIVAELVAAFHGRTLHGVEP